MAEPDLSEFQALSKRRDRPDKCLVARTVEALTGPDRVNLAAALEDSETSHATISKWLRLRGVRASDNTVGAHRRGMCCCVQS